MRVTISEQIRTALAPFSTSLRFAYLFGSTAADNARPDSDVDVAVDFGRHATAAELVEIASSVEAATGREADVIDLRNVGPILQMQVLRHGIVVHDADPKARALFEMHTPSIYEDFQRERAPIVRAILEGYGE